MYCYIPLFAMVDLCDGGPESKCLLNKMSPLWVFPRFYISGLSENIVSASFIMLMGLS